MDLCVFQARQGQSKIPYYHIPLRQFICCEVISGLSRLRLPRHAQNSLPQVPAILDLTLRIRRASDRKTVSDAKFLTGHHTWIMSFEIRNLKYQSE